ncbi:hypothetical protein ANN_10111 [Periplaneta americana]|uniref:Uncharacterized protein n=1 Tax=Periplaneta americana TaxID=6978 RepID=A0ABQ8TR87_PERAM|nr:hypothetical protein ANN_10111 [Periplaneta americana]
MKFCVADSTVLVQTRRSDIFPLSYRLLIDRSIIINLPIVEVISASPDVPEFCPAGVLLHASKSTDMSLSHLSTLKCHRPGPGSNPQPWAQKASAIPTCQPGYDGWINFENETQDRQEWRNAICEREGKYSGFSYDLLDEVRTIFRGMVLRHQPGEYCRRNGRTYYEHVAVPAPKFFTDSLNGISVPYILIGDKFGVVIVLNKCEWPTMIDCDFSGFSLSRTSRTEAQIMIERLKPKVLSSGDRGKKLTVRYYPMSDTTQLSPKGNDQLMIVMFQKCYVLFNDARNSRGYISVAGVPEYCPAILLHASKSTDISLSHLSTLKCHRPGLRSNPVPWIWKASAIPTALTRPTDDRLKYGV